MSGNEKGASETVKFLTAEENHVGRFHGLEVWNRPETLSVMTKRDWSNIHGEVKEVESIKSHINGVGFRMEQNKEGKKTLATLSCLLIIYIYIYIYALRKQKVVEYMYD